MEVTKYEPDTFSWVDYSAKNIDEAKSFYGALFDWALVDVPTPGDPYIMAQVGGKNVAAIMGLTEHEQQQGVPPHWNSYVTVEDVGATAAKITELGGQVLVEPFDVMTDGRMAVVADPTGAVFSLWQPIGSIGAQLVNEPNTFCWNELYTNDLDAAERFYTTLFGWSSKRASSSDNTPLVELYNSGRPAATLMEIQPDWGPMPSAWGVYFAVADCEAAVERAKASGGTAILEPRNIPPGRFAVIQDPQGGVFSIIQLKG